jgi:cation:H+ antiporter
MGIQISFLFFGLVMILVAAEVFTNGVEALGRKFSFSQAVVGSIFAAVGTALPETILPIVAIFLYGGHSSQEIGVGAILGAPFMLSTLAFFLVGITAWVASLSQKRSFELRVEVGSVKRDLLFFVVMYSCAVVLPLSFGASAQVPLAVALILGYVFYAWLTFRGESAGIEHAEEMYFWRMAKRIGSSPKEKQPPFLLILLQVGISLGMMVKGAQTFVSSLGQISLNFGMDPLLFSLLLAPVATELPEKFNSVTWTWKGRDTLAIGNITGAMVFQSTFPVSVGLVFTEWRLTGMALFSAVIAIASSVIVLGTVIVNKRMSPFTMLFSGCLYLLYAGVLILR